MRNRVRLVIRDDDVNYYTNPEDLKNIYENIPGFPISYAVIPYVVEAGACPDVPQTGDARFIGDNKELTDFLTRQFNDGECDILMHGITHEYKYDSGHKIPEMLWRSKESGCELGKLLENTKYSLEQIFEIPINCFVAPHNDIDSRGIQSLPLGMDYSGVVSILFNRNYKIKDIKNYLIRCWYRIIYGIQYPGILDYGTHKELNACTVRNYSFLKKVYSICKEHGYPMAINVHYWHIRDYPDKYDDFFRFLQYAIQDGARPSRMRDCFGIKE